MTNSVGLKPVLSCATVLRENNAKGRTPSQSSSDSTHKALITRLMVLCTRSTALLWGWLTDDLVTLMPNLLKKVVVNSLVKEVPRSDCISRGNPILEKILKRASITFGEVILSTGIASGYLEATQIDVIRYLFCFVEAGRGPTASILILENTSEKMGTNFRGAFALSLGFPNR
ncbi:uncharacterized protein TNCV_751481 [Trichonephila clavipes]|uniref:Uncharacterized protein n=1 Tax=Trichonephila clavipes TaxID=2585209 RepID=A0A8X7BH78_TRICX|nr:uncharacterized protein TNCV_751481 [Trichonephila clavipes]